MSTPSPTVNRVDAERAELESVLGSALFGRSSNPVRFLSFVCEKYFAGETDAIKEYRIAVEALGRPADFDPQSDTIVRVTAHAVRKRLEDFYRTTGADHEVQICLPAGHYVPRFVRKENGNGSTSIAEANEGSNGSRLTTEAATTPGPSAASMALLAVVGLAMVASLLTVGETIYRGRPAFAAAGGSAAPSTGAFALDKGVRSLVGANRPAITDHAGLTWDTDRFCTGGSSFSIPSRPIQGTQDPELFLSGRGGAFQCRIPVAPGTYEVHLLFAETAGLQENARHVAFSVNDSAPVDLDVVDDAGGDDVATTKVLSDVQPQRDGAIHLDFSTAQSFLNAIEVIPSAPHAVLPVRIVTGHSTVRDHGGNVWLPDRYALGGRLSRSSFETSTVSDPALYEWQRIGHFRYVIPVVPGRSYTLRLHFHEPWFGSHNGNAGGPGSRVFDVTCNGATLMKNFDILGQAGSNAVVREFPHIQPTAQGKIEIGFIPVVNYPMVNALEVIPE